ncbi:hypothetical protein FRACYDRAFT_256497 [Fragilariopsis cylindrus CCMP1102]|uniref:Uncharacterized protein n=1 Tax=Fragilariopsis cylindrus CCMP1102 TaxID=635003 RepID=A0A1E7EJM7_9STRA|nr:hypothetical protein FRACYDRAFT_256497 [Fragilariopsis cylindrus CCMP1102]|eukprot:OEU06080.1 hypothetical protein FRACYDRAFT_256497 [Fragilariopsis cylindrus CCMP1102]
MSATTQTETSSSSSRFVRTAHGGLMAPPVVLPIMYLLLVYYREIPFWDCFFSIAYPLYLCLANRFRFDSNKRQIALRTSKGTGSPSDRSGGGTPSIHAGVPDHDGNDGQRTGISSVAAGNGSARIQRLSHVIPEDVASDGVANVRLWQQQRSSSSSSRNNYYHHHRLGDVAFGAGGFEHNLLDLQHVHHPTAAGCAALSRQRTLSRAFQRLVVLHDSFRE